LRNIQNPLFKLSVGKNLALLQAEVSAFVLELANVPNVRWHLSHDLSMKHNDRGMKSCRLRAIYYQVTQRLKRATTLE